MWSGVTRDYGRNEDRDNVPEGGFPQIWKSTPSEKLGCVEAMEDGIQGQRM
jgi:hypothetical protein